jgi:hypothetical protein
VFDKIGIGRFGASKVVLTYVFLTKKLIDGIIPNPRMRIVIRTAIIRLGIELPPFFYFFIFNLINLILIGLIVMVWYSPYISMGIIK